MSINGNQTGAPGRPWWVRLVRLVVRDWATTTRVCVVMVVATAGFSIVGLVNGGAAVGPIKIGCTTDSSNLAAH